MDFLAFRFREILVENSNVGCFAVQVVYNSVLVLDLHIGTHIVVVAAALNIRNATIY